MCITCVHMLYEEHRSAEAGPFDPCPQCHKFPSNEGQPCYHCFSIASASGTPLMSAPSAWAKPWSEEFLAAKAEIENDSSNSIF